jgi:hypothetical protein
LLRVETVSARALAQSAFADPAQTAAGLARALSQPHARHVLVDTWIMMAQGHVAALTDDPGAAIKYDLQAFHNNR